ncbi:unnamed protein product [Adineta steineri]|uniref:G-protein coupled receptors family 1 profile domain-containing protein n=1 Tax=Adineta steineri TaxID=433720 RepID=A0A819KH14_9BILA|nr:unnamed protein product [Adineta steineri]CAF0882616.1 unnamed protein product [Adineta steineri]CAF3848597.1 unnamed protein product [Adineta steineri]CAF3945852.1 unnamed protein product [Adineta steineri]
MLIACANSGQLIWNEILNQSYCQCHPCYQGFNCSELIPRKQQIQFNVDRDNFIISLFLTFLSLLNNLLALKICLNSKRIRRTNIGVYLIIYSLIALIGGILLFIDYSIQYVKPTYLHDNIELDETLHCFLEKLGEHVAMFICLWLSALIALERALIICSTVSMNTSRWRSIKIIFISLCFIIPNCLLMLIYRCEWTSPHGTIKSRLTSALIYTVDFLTGVIYVVSTIIILKNFASRIFNFTVVKQPRWKIYRTLLKTHFFIFLPPVIYLLCVLPYQIWYPINRSKQAFLHCGISFIEYIFKILAKQLPTVSTAITWLIFIYPSDVYMNEFYTKT